MKRRLMMACAILLLTGCGAVIAVSPTIYVSTPPSVFDCRDGKYDNHPACVDPKKMSLDRITESLHSIKTVASFKTLDGRIVQQAMDVKATALFGKYLLTVAHVVTRDKLTVNTPFGPQEVPAEKLSDHNIIEIDGKSYPLERLVIDRKADIALLRVPEGISLKSFPYRLGNSNDLRVGNFLYLTGNPFLLGINVREGIVSVLKVPSVFKEFDAIPENSFMVTNGLNQGDSGMPFIAIRDGEYELVGLAQMSATGAQKLGLAISINAIRKILLESKETPPEFKEFLRQ